MANDFNEQFVTEFRENDGRVGGYFEGTDLMLLHTTGARTGQPRLIPLQYTVDGDDFVVIASNAGADNNPDWYHNLKANPEVNVELGNETFPARAVEVKGEKRVDLYTAQETRLAHFKGYREGTSRVIPLFTLERISDSQ